MAIHNKIESHGKDHLRLRRKMKRWMNKYIRRQPIEYDEVGRKTNRKPTKEWEY